MIKLVIKEGLFEEDRDPDYNYIEIIKDNNHVIDYYSLTNREDREEVIKRVNQLQEELSDIMAYIGYSEFDKEHKRN